jgi:2-polyprenyl-3-methyl-5-hydroxy-6-metoxy-1,4-benzoquinol methylase
MTRVLYRRYRACARYFLDRPGTPLAFAFFRLLRVANRLMSQRRLTRSQVEANRLWKAVYFMRYGATPPYRLEAARPIALDSADHQWPRGTILNSNVNRRFNLKLYDYFRHKPDLRTLDIGCAGGGFVRTLLEDGYDAVGVEGSDISQRIRSGEWDTIPYHLFTADATAPFSFVDRSGRAVLFDCVTAWEVLEHIPEARLGGLLANIAANLAADGIFVGSIALFPDGDPLTGAVYHVTLHEPEWWLDHFRAAGLEPVRQHPFRTEDYVRGHGRGLQDWDPADGDGIHVVMRKRDDARPTPLAPPDVPRDESHR